MESIILAVFGVAIIVIGLVHRTGNISMLHSYHRKRVSEEDRIPFGKAVGSGFIIIGGGMVIAGGLTFAATLLENNICETVGKIAVIAGLVVGLGISFYAMIKYNKGIF